MKVNKKSALGVGALIAGSMILLAAAPAAAATTAATAATARTRPPITVWVDIERKPALEDVAASFTEETGIEVKLVTKDFATVDQDFISQVPTGKGPDVIVSPHDKLGAYVSAGVVAPLELGDVADGFAEASLQAMTYDGKVYGVPYSIENVALVRNADLVAEPRHDVRRGHRRRPRSRHRVPLPRGPEPRAGRPVPPVPAADLVRLAGVRAERRRQLRRLAARAG